MTAMVETPTVVNLGTALAGIFSGPAAGNEGFYDIRLTNYGASAATVRLAISPDNGVTLGWLVYDKTMQAGDSLDVARALPLPTGWSIQARAGQATTINCTITGTKRAAT